MASCDVLKRENGSELVSRRFKKKESGFHISPMRASSKIYNSQVGMLTELKCWGLTLQRSQCAGLKDESFHIPA